MITGAVFGVIGSAINRGLSIFETRQQAKIDEKKRSDEFEMAKLGANKDSLVASYTHDTSLNENVSQWVSNVRALVRPAITGYGLLLITIFYFYATDNDKAVLIASTADLTTMAVTWWFSDRFKK
jgi:hypothetical protein